MGKEEARPDIIHFKKRIIIKQPIYGFPGGQISQHMLHGNPHIPDNRLAAENIGANGDSS